MKILNITHFGSLTNYGALLQAYALQTFLAEAGHDPVLVRASFSLHNRLRKWYRSPVAACKALLAHRAELRAEKLHPRDFAGFAARYMKTTPECYHTAGALKKARLQADVLITGSDQVWSSKRPFPPYFLHFGPAEALRVSYAASIGSQARLGEEYLRKFAAELENFSAVSVREDEGLEQCRRAGRPSARLVPDPVLLLDADHYREKFSDPQLLPEKPFVLVYLVAGKNLLWPELLRRAGERGCEVVAVSSQKSRIPDKFAGNVKVVYPTIPQWLTLIDHAETVITDSFHGTLFSLLFGTPPLVVRKNSHDARFDTLCGYFPSARTALQGRAVYDRIDGGAEPDPAAVADKIARLREVGRAFLSEALSGKRI